MQKSAAETAGGRQPIQDVNKRAQAARDARKATEHGGNLPRKFNFQSR